MKKSLFVLSFFFLLLNNVSSQDLTCKEVIEILQSIESYPDRVYCYSSSWLQKVEYYDVKGDGYVIAYIKPNEYSYTYKPYVFCGISNQRWRAFKMNSYNSCGEAFNQYIMDYQCNCR